MRKIRQKLSKITSKSKIMMEILPKSDRLLVGGIIPDASVFTQTLLRIAIRINQAAITLWVTQ